MRRFQQEFAAQLPDRLQEARRWLAACRAAPADDTPLRELHRCVHRIAGSAGTFGMPLVSQQARALEESLEDLLQRPGRDAAAYDPIGPLLDELAARPAAA